MRGIEKRKSGGAEMPACSGQTNTTLPLHQYIYALVPLILLLWAVLGVYVPSLSFGFIWDDPVWYGHVVGRAWWQTLLPNPDFQFYRPLTMLTMWAFRGPDGTFAVASLHGSQIGLHLLNVVLVYAISRRLTLPVGTAVTVAALFAFHPFLYQAVAWAAPQQPLVALWQNAAVLTYLWARPLAPAPTAPTGARLCFLYGSSFLFFALALAVQESSVTVAIVPLLIEIIARPAAAHSLRQRIIGWRWALVYPFMAGFFMVIWLLVPRKAGITGVWFDGRNIPYLLQSLSFPLLGRPQGYTPEHLLVGWQVTAMALVTAVLLWTLAYKRGRGRVALFGLAWAVAAILPVLVGLGFAYVSLASRLLYAPAPGICLLWGCALWPRPPERLLIRAASVALIGLILLQSIWLLWQFGVLWQAGREHLQAAVAVLDEPGNERVLFLNFPDRYAPERPPYPMGYWGVTLAPVVVELADFQARLSGQKSESFSRSMPWLGQMAREDGPYQVDMRGVIVQPEELGRLAAEMDGVYVSAYLPDGRFQLQYAGALGGQTADCGLARFGEAVCLHEAQLAATAVGCQLTLVWSTTAPLPPHLTIFAHVGVPGQPPIMQADGDTWRGALPLANWPLHTRVVDERSLPCPDETQTVQVGVYDWVAGERLPGMRMGDGQSEAASGASLPYDAWQVTERQH